MRDATKQLSREGEVIAHLQEPSFLVEAPIAIADELAKPELAVVTDE